MHGLNLATLADGRRAIIIRTSDRAAFKSCRRKWGFSSHLKMNLSPKALASPLWFGSAIHYALEDYHGWNVFGHPRDAFKAYCIATAQNWKRDLPSDAQEHYEMGKAMMDYYVDYWLAAYPRKADKTYWCEDPVTGIMTPQVEVNFEIPLPIDPINTPLLHRLMRACGADCVLYRGTIDRVVVDDYGHLFCVAEDTWVQGPNGFVKIQDHPDTIFQGVKKTVTVQTNRGYQVECTPDHRILCSRGWVKAQNLIEGDSLVIHSQGVEKWAQEDPDYWWTVGYWLGDGSLRNHGRGSIDFSTGKDKDELGERLKKFFESRGETPKFAENKKTTGYWYVTNQAAFADDLREMFGTTWDQGKTAYKKNLYIPFDKIKNLPAFLQGLFDADGSASLDYSRNTINLCSKSERLMRDVQIALTAYDIHGKVSTQSNKYGTWWRLDLPGFTNCAKFRWNIGFSLERKQSKLVRTWKANKRSAPSVTKVIDSGREVKVYDLLNQPANTFAANGLAVHNCDEYKTAKVFQNTHYQTDPQVTTYVWAMSLIYDLPIEGVIYEQFIKKTPKQPKLLATGGISVALHQNTSYPLYKEALESMYGDAMKAPSKNQAYMNTLMSSETGDRDRYIIRERIARSPQQCGSEAQKIMLELEDMINPDLPLYPNPTRDCSRMCSFMTPCVNMDDGSDWEQLLEELYMPRDTDIDRLWRSRLPDAKELLKMSESRTEPDLEGIQAQSLEAYKNAAIAIGEYEAPEWQTMPDPFGGMDEKGRFNMAEVD